jgi:UDPglucose 6-dehydrogenase
MKVSVIGTGYVGLVTATCFAFLGHEVACLDINKERIDDLNKGQIPIYEPGLEKLLEISRRNDKFPIFSTDPEKVISFGDFVFIAVGTPPLPDGEANLEYLKSAAESIGKFLKPGAIVINKSTVPVGSGNWVKMLVEKGVESRSMSVKASPVSFTVASNPEFLREGTAIFDTLYPDRIVIGTEDQSTEDKLKLLYTELKEQKFIDPSFCKRPEGFGEVPIIATDITSAEMIKYSANSFLAMKISFANQIANICDLVGADVTEVMHGIGSDSRIGNKFLSAGIGWGGSCFGKDVQALIKIAEEYNYSPELLEATKRVNYKQRELVIKRLQEELKIIKGKRIGLLGLAFKPNTDDLRDAPALDIAKSLIKLGARVSATDPIAIGNCMKQFPDLEIDYKESAESLAKDLDAIILVTEWDEYKNLDLKEILKSMSGKLFIDGRNQYQASKMREIGFNYIGVGRS